MQTFDWVYTIALAPVYPRPAAAPPSSSNFNSTKSVFIRNLSGWTTDRYMSVGVGVGLAKQSEKEKKKNLGISHLRVNKLIRFIANFSTERRENKD